MPVLQRQPAPLAQAVALERVLRPAQESRPDSLPAVLRQPESEPARLAQVEFPWLRATMFQPLACPTRTFFVAMPARPWLGFRCPKMLSRALLLLEQEPPVELPPARQVSRLAARFLFAFP